VAAVAHRPATEVFRFRRLDKPEEFRQAEEVQRAAWGMTGELPTDATIMRAIQDNAGLILGAFADIHLAGVCLGFLGWDGTQLYHYSHMNAVRPEYQNHHVGFRLKAYQRDEVLRQGLNQIRWTFDPLQSKNAMLNVRRLGGIPDKYYVHYYGQMDSDVNRGLETDRFRLVWDLSTPRVEERMRGKRPSPDEDLARLRRSQPLITTSVGESGLRVPTEVEEASAPEAAAEIPFDLAIVREHEPNAVRTWRHATRDAFRAALDAGYRIDDFAVLSIEHERRSFYFLSAPERSPAGPRSG
jgi:predicted GNAT superfamily acetyltransferase